jgi:hypothetical protein
MDVNGRVVKATATHDVKRNQEQIVAISFFIAILASYKMSQ